ncbi:MAG: ribonuclease HII [Candidatus Saccharimonadales bacterium]
MIVVGVDEVGRGCWAGPLVAGAVIFDRPMRSLRDSKELVKTERERLAERIHRRALACGLGWVTPAEIDELGMTGATSLAMRRAVDELATAYDEIIIDGIVNYLKDDPAARPIVKADASVPVVSAASIIAKVARDDYMAVVAQEYPDYGFEQHVGYGTSMHQERLELHGVSALHRRSFKPIRALL